ncbi:short chain dehydrogenase [Leucobacter sp. G161]|uniref:short chain dehydrogenase n=1 Tax=Leucobacter sp. G161 TaxID=663704 RepID=UPI00073B3732|nr:short chain dehydrogenase [Leucobacter sp. G161]KUF06808.1 short-chain dehydrogenase [Leucobacter sp. G161]
MKTLVIGATGHIGSAAVAALAPRHEVIGVGRTSTPGVDIEDPASIQRLFETVGRVDAVICAVGSAPFKPASDLSLDDFDAAYRGKVFSQLAVFTSALPYLTDGGSITLTTGILAREPVRTGAAASLANGAIEAFVMAAAPELPRGIRINAVSPSVLREAHGYHALFAGFEPVPSERVGLAFVRSVEGIESGRSYEVN